MNDLLLQPGTTFGRYEIHERIARGGMGEVWFATAHGESGFQKKVVIKTVRPDLAANPRYIRLLIQEASLAAQLSHPNIVQVFDLGSTDGIYYIAMEYLPGRTLAQVLHRVRKQGEQVPVWLALSAAAACCDGLHYAHERRDDAGRPLGLLHQDISPSNVMLSFSGHVTILDFGVAKAIESDEETRTLTIKGKYHYMAPERIQGLAADRRSDLYSLGVVIYQLLTLHRPFVGSTEYELLNRIVNEPPPLPTRYAPWLPGDVEQLIMKALAKNPRDRQPNAYTLGADLRACLRRLGEVHEARDRAEYMSALFPESPDSMANHSAMASLAASHEPHGVQHHPASPVQSLHERATLRQPNHASDRAIDLFSLPPDVPSDPAGQAMRDDLRLAARHDSPSGGIAELFGEPPTSLSSIYDERHGDRSGTVSTVYDHGDRSEPVSTVYDHGERGERASTHGERGERMSTSDIFSRGARGDVSDVFTIYESRPPRSSRRVEGPDFYRTSRSTTTLDYWPWGSDSKQRKAKD